MLPRRDSSTFLRASIRQRLTVLPLRIAPKMVAATVRLMLRRVSKSFELTLSGAGMRRPWKIIYLSVIVTGFFAGKFSFVSVMMRLERLKRLRIYLAFWLLRLLTKIARRVLLLSVRYSMIFAPRFGVMLALRSI